jgi:6,7-dimethyl-8-ribityllumazine synthase
VNPTDPSADGRWAICVGSFYGELAERLVRGATDELTAAGASPDLIDVFEVPGAFELPLAAQLCARDEDAAYSGVICLGAVIRGETDHYDFVCREAARGIQDVQLETGVPCGFGVLTVDSMEQALERTGGGVRDQGAAAARAAVAMAGMKKAVGVRRPGR